MELFFLALLIIVLAVALGSGYPVAFAIPGAAILTIALAALCGYLFAGDVDAYFVHGGGPGAWLSAGVTNFRSIYRSDENDILIAIPLFIFMGVMLQRSKIAEDLLLTMTQLFGAMRGGLGISVVLVGALLAATTGIVGAAVVAMGTISLPTMLRNNYSKPLASGLVAATGTLGQIIPPSIVLLILVQQLTTAVSQAGARRNALYRDTTGEFQMPSEFDVLSVSAGEMFMGAFVPGLILVALYMVYVFACAYLRPENAPAVSHSAAIDRKLVVQTLTALAPPLTLIILVLGSIIAGVATVNQAGAIGAAGATIMAGYRLYEGKSWAFAPAALAILGLCAIGLIVSVFSVNLRKVETNTDVVGIALAAIASATLAYAVCWSTWRTLKVDRTLMHVMEETTKTTSLVFMILLGAVMLTAAFRAFGGEELVRSYLQTLPGGFWGQFIIVMLIIFLLGFVLDFIEITVVVVPIVAPILLADPAANIAAVWLGVMIALNIQTSFLTPPFGFALFYLRGVTPPTVSTLQIYKGVVPFIAIQLVVLAIVGVYPRLVTYVPNRVLLLSDTAAPPTTTPRLQFCIEDYLSGALEDAAPEIRASIARIKTLDFGALPANIRKELVTSFESAESAFGMMKNTKEAGRRVALAAVEYRPIHTRVRELERAVRRIDRKIVGLETAFTRTGDVRTEHETQQVRDQISELNVKRRSLLAQWPADWDARRKSFVLVQKEERDARRAFRRTVDAAYLPLSELLESINDVEKLTAIKSELRSIEDLRQSEATHIARDRIKSLRSTLASIRGTVEIRAALGSARRALRKNPPNLNDVQKSLADVVVLFEEEIDWRITASRTLLRELTTYERAIANTIGLRGQERLPDAIAVKVASCTATPRDISLHF